MRCCRVVLLRCRGKPHNSARRRSARTCFVTRINFFNIYRSLNELRKRDMRVASSHVAEARTNVGQAPTKNVVPDGHNSCDLITRDNANELVLTPGTCS
jgi:hypothetical protein